jgi:hypothetical protein
MPNWRLVLQIDIEFYKSLMIKKSKVLPMKAVDHFQLATQILLVEVVEHSSVNETLHEGGPVLWQPKGGKPRVSYPLVVHVPERKSRPRGLGRRRTGQGHHLLDCQPQLQSVQRIALKKTQI